jgi:hypothetical protein
MDLRDVGWGQELDRLGSEQGQVAGFCEFGNERSGFLKSGGNCCIAHDVLGNC